MCSQMLYDTHHSFYSERRQSSRKQYQIKELLSQRNCWSYLRLFFRRAEHLYNFGVREEIKTFDDTEDDEVYKSSDDLDVDADPANVESFLDINYQIMAYSKIKSIWKAKDVFKRDDNFSVNTYSKK